MAFDDLNPDEAQEFHQKYKDRSPEPERLFSVADRVQSMIQGPSGIIGGLTVHSEVQSTKTRRIISASVDLLVEEADITPFGEEFTSWSHNGAYFADVDDVEVGILRNGEFPAFTFPDSALENRYEQEVLGFELTFAEPESNMTSKFNRLPEKPGEEIKGSDYLDMNSHLHWYSTEDGDFEYLAALIDRYAEGNHQTKIDNLRSRNSSFNREEWEVIEDSHEMLEEQLKG